jgi:hypothetical protein
MALEDAQLKHGDETQPIENPEAHLKAYRESVKIMKSLGPTWPSHTHGVPFGISTLF